MEKSAWHLHGLRASSLQFAEYLSCCQSPKRRNWLGNCNFLISFAAYGDRLCQQDCSMKQTLKSFDAEVGSKFAAILTLQQMLGSDRAVF
jgi:hypothetical protein